MRTIEVVVRAVQREVAAEPPVNKVALPRAADGLSGTDAKPRSLWTVVAILL
jgi:hypothetical protein